MRKVYNGTTTIKKIEKEREKKIQSSKSSGLNENTIKRTRTITGKPQKEKVIGKTRRQFVGVLSTGAITAIRMYLFIGRKVYMIMT